MPRMHRGEIGPILQQLDELREEREHKQLRVDVERLAQRLKAAMRETEDLREKIIRKERDIGTIFMDENSTSVAVDIEDILNGGLSEDNRKRKNNVLDTSLVTSEDLAKIADGVRSATALRLTAATQAWLPDGYSQIFRFYLLGPSGLKDYGSATLRCKI